jgi:5-methylthioadenosine/S-adenosylhomocysteine deaminase
MAQENSPLSLQLDNISWLVTQNQQRSILRNTSILLENGIITEIGTTAKGKAAQTIDCEGKIVLPGLINTHTHLSMTMFRGVADDMKLQDWLQTKIWPLELKLNPDVCRYGALLGCLEMIGTGTTTFVDMYFFMEEVAKTVVAAGLRGYLSYGVFGTEENHLDQMCKENTQNFIKFMKELNHPRVKLAIGPHAPYSCSPELLMWCKEVAEKEQAILHTHLAETRTEQAQMQKAHGMPEIEYLDRLGFLYPNLLAAHCVWLTKSEISILAERGVKVSHCPVSNMKLASGGMSPVPEMLKGDVTVSLGTDGAASNNSLDMFETMKICALAHKAYRWDATILNAQQVLDMATIEAARALGIDGKVGSIETGKWADLIVINARAPNLVPIHGPAAIVSNLVYSAKGQDVETTIVDGKIIMRDREFQTLNNMEIYKKSQEQALAFVEGRDLS